MKLTTTLTALAAVALTVLGLAAGSAQAAFPGANGRIAFASDRDGNVEIYTVREDGTGLVRLTNSPGSDRDPAWSPDGRRIAFVSNRDGNAEIYTMLADGSDLRRLTNHAADDVEPAWSPDGLRIVFRSQRVGNELYVVNSDGSGLLRLTTNKVFDARPAWSPDGRKIAFVQTAGYILGAPVVSGIYTMNPDGTGVARVTRSGFDDNPTWTPDGSRILFSTGRDGNAELYWATPTGSAIVRLTSSPAMETQPAVSPDGRRIAFTSGILGEIYVMPVDGSGAKPLAAGPGSEIQPDWQPLPSRPID